MPAGQVNVGGVLSPTVNICEQVAVLLHESFIEYVLVTVLGQDPVAVWLARINVDVTRPQLSEVVPPADVNCARLEYAAGRLPKHCTVVPALQEKAGGVISLTMNTCEQVDTLPQESATEYVLVTVLGQDPEAVWLTMVYVEITRPQLSEAEPPAVVN